ncbi:MAG: hypothetical protein HYX27_23875 [Acidobacteria bacterium]|nr:hypothetical protein [Acidobacteriota bacterium]
MLESTEREVVIRLLRDNVFNTPNPLPALQAEIGATLAAKIPFAANPEEYTKVTILTCENEPWRRQGDHPLIDLISIVRTLDPSVPAIVKRLRSVPLPPNPYTAEILDGGTLFLGRDNLRTLVPQILQPNGQCVLRINGEPKSGKSHSFRFLKFLHLQSSGLVPIKMENPGPATPAEVVAETLISRMGCAPENPPRLTNETPLRKGTLLADWVLNLALRTKPSNWWFVLDNFDDASLPDDTKEFIRQLALQIANGLGRSSIRLVLINYKSQLPHDLRRLQTEELIPKDKADWIKLVRTYYDRLADTLPPAKQPAALTARDATVQELRDVADDAFLQTLCEAIEDDTDVLTAK